LKEKSILYLFSINLFISRLFEKKKFYNFQYDFQSLFDPQNIQLEKKNFDSEEY